MTITSGTHVDADILVQATESTLLDEAAFERLYAQSARPLWSYLYRVLGNAAQAEDLMQDAFLRLLQAPVGSISEDAQRAYLFRIASNLAIDSFRRDRRKAGAHEAIGRHQPQAAEPVERDLDTVRTFGELGPRERAMLWMAYVEGSAHDEIAQSLNVKPASVRVLLHRARRRLAGLLTRATPRGGRR